MASDKNVMNYIEIPDDFTAYPVDKFCVPKHYDGDLENVMIPNGLILDRTECLAKEIFNSLDHTKPLAALCVLKGGYQFFSDLMGYMQKLNANSGRSIPTSLDFIRLKSYENGKSIGEVRLIGNEAELSHINGKNVLIVEDLIDTGKTMAKLLEILGKHEAHSISVVTLLVKRNPNTNGYRPDFIGFEIPDVFVVGDYNEYFRDLKHICVMSEHGKKKYAIKN